MSAPLQARAGRAPAEPTEEQLHLAFRHLGRPNLWPATVQECMRKPHFAAALRALALRMHRGGRGLPPVRGALHSLPTHVPVPPTPAGPPAPAQAQKKHPATLAPGPGHWVCRPSAATLDRKRLAANDKD